MEADVKTSRRNVLNARSQAEHRAQGKPKQSKYALKVYGQLKKENPNAPTQRGLSAG